MKSLRSGALLVAISAGMMLAASPAFAWVCTAKNARGATYSAVGIFYNIVKDRAMAKCRADSPAAVTCVIINCLP